ncbi:MAG: tyrosine recombinase XerC [Oscillospiraceae bacterium]|jgi:site-specific recombinase XerD|nr:tyrosine recombinase XerC [Oscillospiraceae bacterium]
MDYRSEAPQLIKEFLIFHETIKGHSKKTVNEYYLDLRTFFRYIKYKRGLVNADITEISGIDISDVGLELIASVTLTDVYDFLSYLSRDREIRYNLPAAGTGLSASSRSRKISCIRSFYKYLTEKVNIISENPVKNLDSPKLRQSLPRYLSLEQSISLLGAVSGKYRERDYCILTLFLNCGLRISELCGVNISDIVSDSIRILGKGNKERTVFLNDSCMAALDDYLTVRRSLPAVEHSSRNALFISRENRRISPSTVHVLVKKYFAAAGIDQKQYSAHKLRHTAATLMHQNGVDVRTLQEILGHENLNTTQIYTHVDNNELRLATKANPLNKVKKPK